MSRRQSLEEKNALKKTYFFILAGIISLFLFFIIGIPLLIDFSAFLSNILSTKKVVSKKNERYLQQPQLEIPYTATSSAQIDISGFGAINTENQLFVNNSEKNKTEDNKGNFIFKNVSLKQGDNEIYVVAKDTSSQAQAKSDISVVTLDTKKPEITLDNVNDNQEFNLNNQIAIKGRLNEDGSVYLNDAFVMTNSDKTFNYNYQLKDGDNVLKFIATDAAGNTSEKQITVKFHK